MQVEIRGAQRLSFRERQVVALKEMGMSSEAIAKRLGISPGTVSTLLNRARVKGYEVVIVIPGEALGIFPADDRDGGDEGEKSRVGSEPEDESC